MSGDNLNVLFLEQQHLICIRRGLTKNIANFLFTVCFTWQNRLTFHSYKSSSDTVAITGRPGCQSVPDARHWQVLQASTSGALDYVDALLHRGHASKHSLLTWCWKAAGLRNHSQHRITGQPCDAHPWRTPGLAPTQMNCATSETPALVNRTSLARNAPR